LVAVEVGGEVPSIIESEERSPILAAIDLHPAIEMAMLIQNQKRLADQPTGGAFHRVHGNVVVAVARRINPRIASGIWVAFFALELPFLGGVLSVTPPPRTRCPVTV
jgi:hypothetical protein